MRWNKTVISPDMHVGRVRFLAIDEPKRQRQLDDLRGAGADLTSRNTSQCHRNFQAVLLESREQKPLDKFVWAGPCRFVPQPCV